MKIIQTFFLTALFILGLTTARAQAQSPDFSGKWQIDKAKTNFGRAPEYVLSHALNVTQTNSGLTVDRTQLNAKGEEKHYTQTLRFDGKSTQTITSNGNMETDSLQAHSGESLTLGTSSRTPAGAPILNAAETWTLEDNGHTLVIDRKVQQSNGMKFGIKGYYDKQ